MFFLLLVLGLFVLFIFVIWFTTLRIEMVFKREQGNDRGEVIISAWGGLFRYRLAIPQLQWEGIDQGMKVESQAKLESNVDGAATKATQKKADVMVNKRKIKKMKESYRELVENISFFHQTIRWFLSKVTCEKLVWKTRIGTGDAAEAGILTGVAWTVKSTLVGWVSQYIKWRQPPELYVDPQFQTPVIETHLHSIIHFKIGHAIIGIKRLLFHMRKGRVR
ncbi:DUF2953 domain-containing protein [Laceyella putida]|uniref:DUF2953 domain-containing protein n=1 Tax=Laceyella putida TaxID=110101 RepID=A0ABW2RN28_9BACL